MDVIVLDDGKYRFYMIDDILHCNRYGEPWRNFVGDHVIHLLFEECLKRKCQSIDSINGQLIDQIQQVRAKNNKIWMDIVRLAFKKAPEEAKALMREIVRHDKQIDILAEKLGEG